MNAVDFVGDQSGTSETGIWERRQMEENVQTGVTSTMAVIWGGGKRKCVMQKFFLI